MIIKRENVKFSELFKNDKKAKDLYDKSMSLVSDDMRHHYYTKNFLNLKLVEREMDWALPYDVLMPIIEGFKQLDIEEPYVISDELKKEDIPFLVFKKREWDDIGTGIEFSFIYRDKEQIYLGYERYITIEKYDLEQIKNIVLKDMWNIEEIGEDYTREPKVVVMDGTEIYFYINCNGYEKEITCWNIDVYEDDKGLSPNADKLLEAIKKLNNTLKKYNLKIKTK